MVGGVRIRDCTQLNKSKVEERSNIVYTMISLNFDNQKDKAMFGAKVNTYRAIIIFFILAWVSSGCNLLTSNNNNVPYVSVEEKISDLYNQINTLISAVNDLANWILVVLIFSIVFFLVLAIYSIYQTNKVKNISNQQNDHSEKLTSAQAEIKKLSQEVMKANVNHNALADEQRQSVETIVVLEEILYELASPKYRKQLIANQNKLRTSSYQNKDELQSFVKNLIKVYHDAGGYGYISLKTVSLELRSFSNFESLLRDARRYYPHLIRLETDNQGQTLIKITEGE